MTDQPAAVDDVLERVITAAREHLAAVKAAGGAIDDENVWRTYVALNNASYAYDQLLLEAYGEVTPWDTEEIDLEGRPRVLTEPGMALGERSDPHPAVVSVRQRRDYLVPSTSALLAAGKEAAQRAALDENVAGPSTVGEAVLELVRDGDGSLAGLDVPELEPQVGVITVVEVAEPLDLRAAAADPDVLFRTGEGDRVIARLDEEPYDEEGDSSAGGDSPAGSGSPAGTGG
ncbi:MAG TPA: hypothetical protein VIL37_07235 [Natronosporangium sp.]